MMETGGYSSFSGELETQYLPNHGGTNFAEIRNYPNFYRRPTGPNDPPKLGVLLRLKIWWGSKLLQWRLDHGLAQRGRNPNYIPVPKGILAKLYLKVFK